MEGDLQVRGLCSPLLTLPFQPWTLSTLWGGYQFMVPGVHIRGCLRTSLESDRQGLNLHFASIHCVARGKPLSLSGLLFPCV